MLFKSNNSLLYYLDNCGIVNDYYYYIVNLFKKFLMEHKNIKINIIFSNIFINLNNRNKNIWISLNYEHTLVKKGFHQQSINYKIGKILDDNKQPYLVRNEFYDKIKNSTIIIDYSIPNIYNIKISNLFNDYANKHIYIFPSLYECYFIKDNRNINVLTTFINTEIPRRKSLLDSITKREIQHINVNDCFDRDKLRELYKNTKILINIHQTDYHHTFEELRVLPALQNGIIVVSEISALINLVPYKDFVIWTTYETLLDKVNEIINNYDFYFDLIFKNKDTKILEYNILENINYNTLSYKILSNI